MLDKQVKAQVAALVELTGRPVRVGPYDSVRSVLLGDDVACIEMDVYIVEESASETRIVGKATRLMMWARTESGPWKFAGASTAEDTDFVPIVQPRYGYTVDQPGLGERADKLQWELLCNSSGVSFVTAASHKVRVTR